MTTASALMFLDQCKRRKSLNRKRTSYGWKHIAERAVGSYVSNEQFIEAARAKGFQVQMIPGFPTAFINISERSARLEMATFGKVSTGLDGLGFSKGSEA